MENELTSNPYVEVFYEDLLYEKGLRFTERNLEKLLGVRVTLSGSSSLAKQGPQDLRENLTCDKAVLDIIAEYDRRVATRKHVRCFPEYPARQPGAAGLR